MCISFLHYINKKIQKYEIDILLEFCRFKNISKPQEQLIFKWRTANPYPNPCDEFWCSCWYFVGWNI